MRKKLIKLAVQGFPIGISIGLIYSILICYMIGINEYSPAPPIFTDQFSSSLNAMVVPVVIWGLIGTLFSSASLIFTDTDWSITKMTIIHFIVTYLLFLPLSIVAKWYRLTFSNLLLFTAIFIVMYALYWMVGMLKTKKKIEEINAKL